MDLVLESLSQAIDLILKRDQRIAELEAELSAMTERCGQAEVALENTEADAKEAEAEVERLNHVLDNVATYVEKLHSHDWGRHNCSWAMYHSGVNP